MGNTSRQERLERFREETEGLENVIGVGYDPEADEIVAIVEEKKEEEELSEDQLVAANTSLSKDEHGVVEVGHLRAHLRRMTAMERETGDQPVEPESSERHRPVLAGAEEQPNGYPFVGTGSVIARVVDPLKGRWTDDVTVDTVVRLSNWHVYVIGEFEPHLPIHQPYGGESIGELVGGVPLTDGVTVDVAARSVSEHDGWGVIGLSTAENGEEYGRSVLSDVTGDHGGQTVIKSGRTTDVTTARIELIDVSVDVDYGEPDDPHPIRVNDCVITSDLGDGGDSGSAVYLTATGALCGLYFAGSDVAGVFVQMGNIAEELGVEPIVDWGERPPIEYGQPEPDDAVQRFKEDVIDYIENWSP